MDLIYADKNGKEIGVLDNYDLDLDVANEKDFEISVPKVFEKMKMGYVWYIDETEYGGIIRKVKRSGADTIFTGLAIRGILNKKVIIPDEEYKEVSGRVDVILSELISDCELNDLFVTDSCELEIPQYRFERYCTLHDGIERMLKEYDMVMVLKCHAGKVHMAAKLKTDYSDLQQYGTDGTRLDNIEKDEMGINHLICLGSGEMIGRKVIHLFTDENGGILPFSEVETPLRDSDYIRDDSQKVFCGLDEVAEIYDYPNAETVENYIIQDSEPTDWSKNFSKYYEMNEDAFELVRGLDVDIYQMTKERPQDWDTNCTSYYIENSNGYTSVSAKTVNSYTKTTKKPSDWTKNYANYFVYVSDGTYAGYESVSGEAYSRYEVQTVKPSEWSSEFGEYYKKADGKYVSVKKGLPFKIKVLAASLDIHKKASANSDVVGKIKNKDGHYVITKADGTWGFLSSGKGWIYLSNENVKKYEPDAPTWSKKKYYTKKSHMKAPEWSTKYYKLKSSITEPPTWKSETYFTKTTLKKAPSWLNGKYYTQVLDHYAELVAGGIEYLTDHANKTTADIDLEEIEYSIGDIVGGREDDVEVKEEINNIIVKVTDGNLSVEYEIGGR